MASPVVILGFTPIVSAPSVNADEWDVQAEVDDPTERFSGYDVSVGDIVFLDLLSSTTAPMTAGRYIVETILSRSAGGVRVVLSWDGYDVAVDPVEAAGHRGYLTRASQRNGLAWHPSARSMMIPIELIEAARNTENFVVVDRFSTGGAGSNIDQVARDRQVKAIPTDRTFTIGQVVTRKGGVTDLANPQSDLKMPAIGVALGMGSGTVLVQCGGLLSNPVFSFEPGLPVFVSDLGTLTQDPAAVSRPGWLQMAGVAYDATSVGLNFSGQMAKRP